MIQQYCSCSYNPSKWVWCVLESYGSDTASEKEKKGNRSNSNSIHYVKSVETVRSVLCTVYFDVFFSAILATYPACTQETVLYFSLYFVCFFFCSAPLYFRAFLHFSVFLCMFRFIYIPSILFFFLFYFFATHIFYFRANALAADSFHPIFFVVIE